MMGSRVSPKQRMASFMPNQKTKQKQKAKTCLQTLLFFFLKTDLLSYVLFHLFCDVIDHSLKKRMSGFP